MTTSSEEPTDKTVPPRRRFQRVSSQQIIAIMALVIIVVGGSIFFLLKSGSNAVKPVVKGTMSPSPTPSTTPIVITPTQAVFYDTFLDNNHGWVLSNSGGFVRTLIAGMLILSNTNPQTTLVESLPSNSAYDNFKMTIDFTIAQGDGSDSIGVYLRGDSNLDHDYRVDINGNGTFDIAKEYLDSSNAPQSMLLDGPHSASALHPVEQQNTLTVVANRQQISLLLNNTPISTIYDSDYTSGQIALFARKGATPGNLVVSFTHVEVDYLPELTPPPPG